MESIASIFVQTFTDFELIIVDDCSTDSTGLIADEFAKSDSRIKVIHNEENKYFKLPNGSKNDFFLNNNFGACFLYRREIIDTVGYYDEDKFLVEDYDFWMRIVRKYGMERISFLDEIHYIYRLHKDSLTSEKNELIKARKNDLQIEYIDYILDSLMESDDRNKEIKLALYSELSATNRITPEIKLKFITHMPELKDYSYNKTKVGGALIILLLTVRQYSG